MQYELLDSLFWLIAILVLWVAYYWLYRDYALDLFRQRMFALRDDLFDFAADGNLAFDHPAYTTLRTTMNGYVRFGHRLRIFDVFLMYVFLPKRILKDLGKRSFEKKYEASVLKLDKETRKNIDLFRFRMQEIVILYLLKTSFPACIVFYICYILARYFGEVHRKAIRLINDFFGPRSDTINTTAMHEGMHGCTAH
jgi:hypothetical protein